MIAKKAYGVTKPKVENAKSLKLFLTKKEIDVTNVYTVDFENYKPSLNLINGQIPEVLIFDRDGVFIPYGNEQACNAHAFSFVENLDSSIKYATNDSIQLDDAFT